MEASLREKWVSVRGVPTYTLCQGSMEDNNTVIVIIPGNPGVAQYYADFIQELYKRCRLPICCVSHVGHVTVHQPVSQCDRTQDYLSLDGQIQHKLAYIRDFIPSSKRLILIGHSIGCYMILKMLSNETDNSVSSCYDVAKCYLLFPTIEHMALSPNGQFSVSFLKYFRWSILLLTLPLIFLPRRVIQFFVEWYFGSGQIPKCAVEATMKLLSPSSCGNCIYMANTEMQSVCELDIDTVVKNIDRLCFYYGTKDAWCPIEYYHKMEKLFPVADIHLCSHDIEHAFVLHHSEEMASIVSDWIPLN